MPFTKEALKDLYDIRQNDLVMLAVKDELTGKVVQVKDVTTNPTKSYELFRDLSFDNLINSSYIPEEIKAEEIKAEARQEAVAQGFIHGGAADFNQPSKSSSSASIAKNTYQ
jgi:hypothetical protein